MAEEFEEFGADRLTIDRLPFSKEEIAREPEKATAPPIVVGVGFATGEGGRDFVPNVRIGSCVGGKVFAPGAETVVGLFPKEEVAGFEQANGLGDGAVHEEGSAADVVDGLWGVGRVEFTCVERFEFGNGGVPAATEVIDPFWIVIAKDFGAKNFGIGLFLRGLEESGEEIGGDDGVVVE